MLRIHFVDNRQAPVWLADERFTFGAAPGNDLVLDDTGIGAFHAELYQENRFYYLTDLGTPGGTYVNEEKIGERYQVRSGYFTRIFFEDADTLLLDTSTEEATAVVRCTDGDCELASDLGPGEQP